MYRASIFQKVWPTHFNIPPHPHFPPVSKDFKPRIEIPFSHWNITLCMVNIVQGTSVFPNIWPINPCAPTAPPPPLSIRISYTRRLSLMTIFGFPVDAAEPSCTRVWIKCSKCPILCIFWPSISTLTYPQSLPFPMISHWNKSTQGEHSSAKGQRLQFCLWVQW